MNISRLRLPSLNSICPQCRHRRTFSQPLTARNAATKRLLFRKSVTDDQNAKDSSSPLNRLSSLSRHASFNNLPSGSIDPSTLQSFRGRATSLSYKPPPKPHHLHIYATKHNCHITLSAGNRDAIISVSSGNLNFRKAARGSYDAAFQLGAFVMAKIKNMGLLGDFYPGKGGPIRALEVVFRDFGQGREAVTKILMGQEGREIRRRVTRVMDATRLKFGGTRSKKRRRL